MKRRHGSWFTASGIAFEQIEKATPYLVRAEKSNKPFPLEVSDTDLYRSVSVPKAGPDTVNVVVVINDDIINRREYSVFPALTRSAFRRPSSETMWVAGCPYV